MWHVAPPRLTAEYNNTAHKTLLGNTPNDADQSEWLRSELQVANTLKLYKNSKLRRHQIRVGQRFRAPLKRGVFARGFVPRFSAHVYTVEKIVPGGYVESEGLLFKKKDILLVPEGSTDIPTRIERQAGNRKQVQRARQRLSRLDPTYVWDEEEGEDETEEQAQRRAQEELMALDPTYVF